MNNEISISQATLSQVSTLKESKNNGKTTIEATHKESYKEVSLVAATYEQSDEEANVKLGEYGVDMDKILAMKDETDQRMLQLFRDTVKGTGLKQLGGIKGILDKIKAGEEVTLEIEYTAEDVEQAKIDVAEGGYWSAETTSDRLVDFAKALSGGNPEKAEMLKNAFIEGFKEIEEMFGGELPELSYNTYDLTISKLDAWKTGTEEVSPVDVELE